MEQGWLRWARLRQITKNKLENFVVKFSPYAVSDLAPLDTHPKEFEEKSCSPCNSNHWLVVLKPESLRSCKLCYRSFTVLLQRAQTFYLSAPPCVGLLRFLDLVLSAIVGHSSKVCFAESYRLTSQLSECSSYLQDSAARSACLRGFAFNSTACAWARIVLYGRSDNNARCILLFVCYP